LCKILPKISQMLNLQW
jgi:hypothetical protein